MDPRNTATPPPRPTFLYAGAPKSGSSWLFEMLRTHPQIFVPAAKSTRYFEVPEPGPVAHYLAHFAQAGDARAIGEVAHDAYVIPGAAERIHALFPEMRILICLREPGAMAQSLLQWWLTHTTEFGRTPREMARHTRFRAQFDYPARLRPFRETFSKDRLKVLFYDDLKRDPAAFLRDVLWFLDVNPELAAATADRVVNPARQPRFRAITHAANRLGQRLRNRGFGPVVEAAKRSPLVKRLLYSAGPSPHVDEIEAIAREVRAEAAPRLPDLEHLAGRPLPAGWRI